MHAIFYRNINRNKNTKNTKNTKITFETTKTLDQGFQNGRIMAS